MLTDSDPKVQAAAIAAIGDMRGMGENYIDDIAAAMETRDKAIQLAAITALGKIGATGKAGAIEAFLDKQDLDLKAAAC